MPAAYSRTNDPGTVRRADGLLLPVGIIGNVESDAYAVWCAAGGVADPLTVSPSAAPVYGRQLFGNVFLAAVVSLGWWNWMDQGAAAQAAGGKPLDARYWATIGKTDVVVELDPKLVRVAAAAERLRVATSGQPAPAQPLITMGAIMDAAEAASGGT